MIVYVVAWGGETRHGECLNILGVFSSEEKANAVAASDKTSDWSVVSCELDSVMNQLPGGRLP